MNITSSVIRKQIVDIGLIMSFVYLSSCVNCVVWCCKVKTCSKLPTRYNAFYMALLIAQMKCESQFSVGMDQILYPAWALLYMTWLNKNFDACAHFTDDIDSRGNHIFGAHDLPQSLWQIQCWQICSLCQWLGAALNLFLSSWPYPTLLLVVAPAWYSRRQVEHAFQHRWFPLRRHTSFQQGYSCFLQNKVCRSCAT